MKSTILILLVLLYANNGLAQRNEFQWLVGTWKIKDRSEYEIWTKDGAGNHLMGKAFRIKGADTLVTEVISLTYHEGSFHYVPDVAGDQPAIDFKIITYNENSFVAENPKHDFPKIIRYRHVMSKEQERIEAAIEGNGKVIPYIFEKLK